jgi:hypothetical protein
MQENSPPSFSPYRKWGIGLHVALIITIVFSVVVMVNYLASQHPRRIHVSAHTRLPLSQRTIHFLESLTNQVSVTLYYDKDDALYSTVRDLLNAYSERNKRIIVKFVDYRRDAAAALRLKEKYAFLGSASAKNLVIFDCDGKVKPIEGNALAQYVVEQVPNEKEREFRRKPVAFLGENWFTAALLDVTNPKPLKACFLIGHGEHPLDSGDENVGYLKLTSLLQQNYIRVEKLSLTGTNTIPFDCNLLVIAGPTTTMPDTELQQIEQYLNQGGRLLALFNFSSRNKEIGLEKILARWGVQVTSSVVKDPANAITEYDVIVSEFSKQHPVVNPLLDSRLHLIMPRVVRSTAGRNQPADAPQVTEVAFSSPKSYLEADARREAKPFPLIVTVEKGAIKGVITERGTTRMVVVGDSFFLANHQIDSAANRDFAGYAANWLLDRTQLLQGIGPRPIREYKLAMSKPQLRNAQWILLAAMPGTVLAVGSLVWFRRRK